ncbi:uncharacterized protein N7443_005154 [Penicillium atrosanguineum]|uniref:2OG-Fe dioxygenase-domain-containing protein n=1 Tax=Penicillium atrosanguineum TaxID=1132637 RepID=A0A9W9Q8A0_9EURO|nr:uncharacterized protein N7443_005154 [Penicillium atrosanguineum]KAJ5305494.1 hypothetical protein N7443_005154 [Penicillium atrosanguineum]KAJ5324957.1 hypothetical protein N7476_003557 [Penicillium atrosanguineum]
MEAISPIKKLWGMVRPVSHLQHRIRGYSPYQQWNRGIGVASSVLKQTGDLAVEPHLPPLNVQKQRGKAEFYEAIGRICQLRQKYLENRTVFVDGREMVPLLKALGARDEDFATLQAVNNVLIDDPTLPFRKSRNGRFCFDWNTKSLRRLEFQPFALSLEEDFKRHDSNTIRRFDEVDNDLQRNTVFQALLVFKGVMCHGITVNERPKLNYRSNQWVCTLFALRTVTTPEMLGEPALEGVHTDGVDHTMTTYLRSTNMSSNSAVTFLHDIKEKTGIRLNETSPELIQARAQHRNFLDTLLIVDNERKHSISPVYAVDASREATRDMLIFFTRKPVVGDHISSDIDSLIPHREKQLEFPIMSLSDGYELESAE